MTINARPGLNGNTKEDFERHARALFDQAATMEAVLREATAEVFHARNYQHLRNHAQARSNDLARVIVISKAIEDLKSLAASIYHHSE